MTEPKPTQWEIINRLTTATHLRRRDGGVYHEACFIGPDRGEANARKFACMDELVEALKAWDAAANGKGFWSDAENKRLSIIAKIDGVK